MTYFSIHRVSHCFVIGDGKFKVSTNSGKIFLNSTTILELQCIKRQFPTCLKNNYHFHYFSPFQIRIKTRKGDGIFWIVAKIYLTQFHEHYSSKYSFLLHSIPIRVESRLHVRETAFPPPPHSLQMDKRRQLGKFRWARIPLRARAAANVKQRSRYACAVAEKWGERDTRGGEPRGARASLWKLLATSKPAPENCRPFS